MFVTVFSVAAVLAMASPAEGMVETARTSYDNCMIDVTVDNLNRQAAESEYASVVVSACENEKKALFDAIVKYERSEGATASEAKEYAQEEINMTEYDLVQSYAEYLAEGTQPEKTG